MEAINVSVTTFKSVRSWRALRSGSGGDKAVPPGPCQLEHKLVSLVLQQVLPSAIEGYDEEAVVFSDNMF